MGRTSRKETPAKTLRLSVRGGGNSGDLFLPTTGRPGSVGGNAIPEDYVEEYANDLLTQFTGVDPRSPLGQKTREAEQQMGQDSFLEAFMDERSPKSWDELSVGDMARRLSGNAVSDPAMKLLNTAIDLANTWAKREDEQERSAMDMADQLEVDDFLEAEKWNGLQREAALWELNQYKEQNPDAFFHPENLTEEQRQEAERYRELSDRLGGWTQGIDRVGKGARSFWYDTTSFGDAALEIGKAVLQNHAAKRNDPDRVEAEQGYQDTLRELEGYYSSGTAHLLPPGYIQQLKDELDAYTAALQEADPHTKLDMDSPSVQRMIQADLLDEQAKTGLSPVGKMNYDAVTGVVDGVPAEFMKFVPVAGPVLSGAMGAVQTGVDKAVDASVEGKDAEDALLRGVLWGGIDALASGIELPGGGNGLGALDVIEGDPSSYLRLFRRNVAEGGLQNLAEQGLQYGAGLALGDEVDDPTSPEFWQNLFAGLLGNVMTATAGALPVG